MMSCNFTRNMNAEEIQACRAIQQLYREHEQLKEQIARIVAQCKQVTTGSPADWQAGLDELNDRFLTFDRDITAHSTKEENGLFTMLGRHIGTESGPIAVMEYEHQEAKHLLTQFNEEYSSMQEEVTGVKVHELCNILNAACQLLLNHFAKEENVLFPLAENVLGAEEKEALFLALN